MHTFSSSHCCYSSCVAHCLHVEQCDGLDLKVVWAQVRHGTLAHLNGIQMCIWLAWWAERCVGNMPRPLTQMNWQDALEHLMRPSFSASLGCCIEHNSATPKEASQGSQDTLPNCPKLPRFPVPAFIWTLEAGSFQYIFRKYVISFGQESLAVGYLRLPHFCFTFIQTVSHKQPEDKMASLCVCWLC